MNGRKVPLARWERIGPVIKFTHRQQQTPGVIYFASFPELGLLKIGFTKQKPIELRLRSMLSWLPFDFEIHADFEGTLRDELVLHDSLSEHRHRGEWYRDSPALWTAINEVRAAA